MQVELNIKSDLLKHKFQENNGKVVKPMNNHK